MPLNPRQHRAQIDPVGHQVQPAIEFFEHFGTIGGVAVVLILLAVLVIHHFWGRLTLRRIALHFHRHQMFHKPAVHGENIAPPASAT